MDISVCSGGHGIRGRSTNDGGLATTAGIGYLARKYGLTIDHVEAAELVLADGTLVRADREHHRDLFRAMRGAGGDFGVGSSVRASRTATAVCSTTSHPRRPGCWPR